MTVEVAIVTDSTACVPQEQVEKYGITIVPVVFIFGEDSYRDGIDMTTQEFYSRLKQTKKLPTTSGSLPLPYLDAYRQAAKKAKNIVCITASAVLSGMHNSARIAVNMAGQALPGARIEVVDSGTGAAAQGLVVLAAAQAASYGKNLTDVLQVVQTVKESVYLFATLDTLDYLVKGGRVPKAAALASSLLQIKPIFTIKNADAHPVTTKRTIEGAIKGILKIMQEKVLPGKPLHAAVMHADAPERAHELKDSIVKLFGPEEIFITEFTPVMGVHTGPGLVGVAFYN